MSTDTKEHSQLPTPIDPSLTMHDLAVLLVKHYELHTGLYDLMIEFQIGTGAVGPDKGSLSPGAMIGVTRVGLVESKKVGTTTVDAAVVNPLKRTRKKAGT